MVNKAAGHKEIIIDVLPATVEELIALRNTVALSPEGGAVMIVLALMLAARDPADSEARDALTVCVDRSRLVPTADGYQGWSLSLRDRQHVARQLGAYPWAPASYVVGTAPEDGYRLPQLPCRFHISRNAYSGDDDSGQVKVFIACSGAALPRPITLKRNARGVWKAVEWSSLMMGVVSPSPEADDDI